MHVQITGILNNLNEAQREAVTTIFGPVLVIAGPGTGKTQVLAARIAYILQHQDLQITAGQILCLTFTESGVQAMRQRLTKLIGEHAAYRVQIHTFHSFCNKIIQDYPDKFPRFSANPRQITDLEKLKLVKAILQSLDSGKTWQLRPAGKSKDMYVKKILSAIQLLKREGVSADKLRELAQTELEDLEANPKRNNTGGLTQDYQQALKNQKRNLELAEIYRQYQEQTESQNLYDYEDMILQVVERLGEDEELAYEILEKYQFILVDEYQDTNGAQNQILKILGKLDPESQPNIFAVGDDDQAIYRFQGANVENILFFKKEFPEAKLIALTNNYRSTQAILDVADSSISKNSQRLSNIYPEINKQLTATNHFADIIKPSIINFKHSDGEVAWLVKQIQDLQKAGEPLSEVAVIYRNHADALLLQQTLDKLNIPHRLASGSNLLEQPIILKILQLLKAVAYSELDRDHNFAHLLMQNFVQRQFKLKSAEVFTFLTAARDQTKFGHPAYPIQTFVNLALTLDAEHGVRKFAEALVRWQQNFANMPFSEALLVLLNESGLIAMVYGNTKQPEQLEATNSFIRIVRDRTLANPEETLESFLIDLKIYQDEKIRMAFNQPNMSEDAVNLLTAHAAKGLEFKHVFIIKAIEKHWSNKAERNTFKWPAMLFAGDGESLNIEEERRLFYVAMTRAKQTLKISYADVYQDANGESDKQASIFINELDSNLVQTLTYEVEVAEEAKFQREMLRPTLILPEQADAIEQAYLRGLLSNFRLSASTLNTYLDCPLKFKYECLLQIPTVPTPEIALGNAIHKALEQQFKRLQKNETDVSVERAKQDFESVLQQQLLSRHDYDLARTEGLQLIEGYYAKYADTMKAPAGVEYNFGQHRLLLNLPDQEPIMVTGKIDKLEWIDKERNAVRLVDYKTQRPDSENAVRGETKSKNKRTWYQIVFYKILARLDDQFKPAGKMDKFHIEQICIDFLRPDGKSGQLKQLDLHVTEDDEKEVLEVVANTVKSIRNLEFNGGENHPLCGECEYCKLASIAASA